MRLPSIFGLALCSLFAMAQPTVISTLADSGPGSLRLAIFNSSPGDTIVMSPSLIANGSDTLHFSSAIAIPRSLTIIGAINNGDTLFFSGGNTDRLFTMLFPVGSTAEVNLVDLALVKGETFASSNVTDYDDGGGAILVSRLKHLTIKGCTFKGNIVSGYGSGGGILAQNTKITISNSLFFRNKSGDSTSTMYPNGGGLAAFQSKVKIEKTKFIENQCNYYGGAISTHESSVRLRENTFRRNFSTKWYIGGVHNSLTDSTSILKCQFEGHLGIALHVIGIGSISNSLVDSCFFSYNSNSNYLQNHPILLAGKQTGGPAIYVQYIKPIISNSTFLNNGRLPINNFQETDIYFAHSIDSIKLRKCSFINTENTGSSTNTDIYFGPNAVFTQVISCSFIDAKNSSRAIYSSSVFRMRDNIFLFKSAYPPIEPFSTSPTGGILNLGFNIFSNNPVNKVATDLINIDSTALALDKLGTYGGLWPVRVPKTNSPAFNSGNPNDFSPAQNGPIYGIRDRGAAERPVITNDTISACFGPVTWWGNTFTNPGVYRDTASNANSLDSTGVLVLTGLEAALVNNGGLLTASANEPSTFQWINCSNGQVINTGATFLPAANGSYAAVATAGSCVDTTECVAYNEMSLDEQSTPRVVVYPNPTAGLLHVAVNGGAVTTGYVLLDLQGRVLRHGALNHNAINLYGLPAGVYLFRVNLEDGTQLVQRVLLAF
jgi:predicted outer membrane repeat protein